LTSIATGLGVDVPKNLGSEHERMREKLQTLHGKAFDDQYTRDMVEDYNKAVKLFQQEERSGHNTELKQFAQKTLPTLEEHQKMALELSHKLSDRRPITAEPPQNQFISPSPRIFSNVGRIWVWYAVDPERDSQSCSKARVRCCG